MFRFYVEKEDLPVLAPTQKIRYIRVIEMLVIVTKSSILDVTGFLDLLLVIEKIDFNFVLWFVLRDC